MSSEASGQVVQSLLQRICTWIDLESAAVVSILFGLFQVLLSVPLAYSTFTMQGLFMMPLGLGILIVTGGSFTIANERNPSRRLLQGCACSNAIGLLGALIAFCIYCYNMSIVEKGEKCSVDPSQPECSSEFAKAYSWSITLLLLIYDSGAIFLNCLLSVCAVRELKKEEGYFYTSNTQEAEERTITMFTPEEYTLSAKRMPDSSPDTIGQSSSLASFHVF